MKTITDSFPVTNNEFIELDKSFGRLCWDASHKLKNQNTRNNYTDDVEDIKQELLISMMKAGSYYKRQIYTEKCLTLVKKYASDKFICNLVSELVDLWANRTRHGANRQKYGPLQEEVLEKLVRSIVPKKERPNKDDPLNVHSEYKSTLSGKIYKFSTYCKAIVWNGQKSMGKKITKEKSFRSNLVSLSEFDYLGGN